MIKATKLYASLATLAGYWLVICHRVIRHLFGHLFYCAFNFDAVGQMWMTWWLSKAIYSPEHELFFSKMVNYPAGAEVIAYEGAYLHVWLAALLSPLLGIAASLNLVFLFGVALSLAGAFFLFRQLTSSYFVATAFSILFVTYASFFSGAVLDVELADSGIFTFTLAFWLITWRQTEFRKWLPRAALTTLGIVLTCFAQMYFGLGLLLIIGFHALVARPPHDVAQPIDKTTPVRRRAFVVLFTGLALTLVLLLPTFGVLNKHQNPVIFESLQQRSVCNFDFIPAYHSLPLLIVLAVLFLAPFFVLKKNKAVYFGWYLFFLLFLVFAPGVNFKLVGLFERVIITPVYWLHVKLPYYWRLSCHHFRLMKTSILVFFILLAWLQQVAWRERLKNPARRAMAAGVTVLFAALAAPIFIGQKPTSLAELKPMQVCSLPSTPLVLDEIKEEESEDVIFHFTCSEMLDIAYFQMIHDNPVADLPITMNPYFSTESYGVLMAYRHDMCVRLRPFEYGGLPPNKPLPPKPTLDELVRDIKWWKENDVRYLILHKGFIELTDVNLSQAFREAYGEPIDHSDRIDVYDLGP